uniref:Uncharacterized protein n=1 Tax=Ciona savignyi TaxID=51511 RepID=H2YGY8_CIOSA
MSLVYIYIFIFLSFLDLLTTAVIFAHGNQWNLLWTDGQGYNFSTSFVDFWIFPVVRTSLAIGAAFGILRNPIQGPANCKKYEWLITFVSAVNLYYACIKLLVYSHDETFIAGPKLTWFWVLFAWSLIGSALFILQWRYGTIQSGESQQNASINTETSSSTDGLSDTAKDPDEKTFLELVSRATIGKMLSYSVPDWPLILVGTIFLVGASLGQIFLPLFVGKVITAIVQPEHQSNFVNIIIEMAGIAVAVAICSGCRAGCLMYYMQRLNIRIRNALFQSIVVQEIGFFDEVRTGKHFCFKLNSLLGDLTSRLTSDVTTMSDTIGLNFNIFLRNLIKAIGVCIFMFALSWRLSVVTFLGLPLIFMVSKVYGSYYKVFSKLKGFRIRPIIEHQSRINRKLKNFMVQDRFAKANEVAQDVCSSMQTVRSFANESGEISEYKQRLFDVLKIQIKQAMSYTVYVWCTKSFEEFLLVFTLWYGGQLLLLDKISSQGFISFILYQEELGECFSEIGDVYTGMMQALGAAEKVFELIERKPKLGIDDGTENPKQIQGHISFKNVSFSYPSRPDQTVLECLLCTMGHSNMCNMLCLVIITQSIKQFQNVSFEVNPGEVVALVGPSGGGKSSCVKLLQRFYEPTAGSVCLDGIDVSSYEHQRLHELVSLVGQEPVLYARSVRENIVYGLDSDQYSEESILHASKLANAHDFIMSLCDKYNTETGEKGTQLSGGQKQRVAIARALVRNPRVLLLDEATSALDTESEYLVQEALEHSKSHRTVLLIAHRLSTVERADRIIVIVKGKVEETGSHVELMEKQGTYYNLVYRYASQYE